jgi:T3SS (YopN, CesT) and YbjN peptide-binding chaperone 3
LVEGLARALAALDDERSLTLSRRPGVSEGGSNRFVQFAGFGSGSGLRAESVGDRYLEAGDELTSQQRTRLAELGWLPPDEGGNYWRQWTDPLPYHDVAVMALQTLREVHGVEHGEQLDFDASAEILRAFGLSFTHEEIGASQDAPTTRPGGGARHLAYWDYDPDARVECPACHWSGVASQNQEIFKEVLDVRCGSCDTMLLVVAFPTLIETREAAAAGNPRAQAGLADIEEQAAWRERAASTLLTDPMQLPDVPGAAIVIDWDLERVGEENWQVLRHDGVEIWRETGFYESYQRFGEVFEILRRRYGDRLQELRPTPHSEMWLYGDRLGAPGKVEALNRSFSVRSPRRRRP